MVVLTVLTAAAQPPPPLSLTEEERAWLANHQTLRLGVGVAFPPYMWVDQKEDGGYAFKGMVSDYVDLMEERLGVEMQIVFGISFKEALARARDGRIDFFPCISSTPERSAYLLFTEPYFTYPMVIIMREDAPLIGGIKELADKRFATARHLMVYSKLQHDYPDLDLDFVFTGKVEENLEAVSLGRADACIIHLAVASYYIQKKGLTNLRIGAPVYWEEVQHAMAVRGDWPLLRGIVAKTMASISQEERDEISQRWIRVQYEPGVDVGRIVRWALGIGAGVLIVFFLVFEWNHRLQGEITARKKTERHIRQLNALKENLLTTTGLSEQLRHITDGVVKIFQADFARIWVIEKGDRCDSGCSHAAVTDGPHICRHRDGCLHLQASSGRFKHTDGGHGRVPFDCYKIGSIASGDGARFVTNDVANDPRIHDHEWARHLGLVSFAGYRLLSEKGSPVGVLALFSKKALTMEESILLEGLSNTAAHVIQMGMAEKARRKSEALYRQLISQMLNAFALHEIICDEGGAPVDYRFLEVNPAFEEMTGLAAESVIGKTAKTILPDIESYWIDVYGRVALTGKYTWFENYAGAFDRHFDVLAYSPRKNQFATVFTDITDRKQIEVEREGIIKELRVAIEEVKTLQGFIPICAECKNIRDDGGYWQKIEKYVQNHSDAQFSHSICPDCAKKLYPDMDI